MHPNNFDQSQFGLPSRVATTIDNKPQFHNICNEHLGHHQHVDKYDNDQRVDARKWYIVQKITKTDWTTTNKMKLLNV